jgi:hypothetical protein
MDSDMIERLGVDPLRAAVVFGSVMRGPLSFVAIGVLPGVSGETIEHEYIAQGHPGVRRTVGGVVATVRVGPESPAAHATWATDERLFMVATRTERSLPRFVRAVVALPQPAVVVDPLAVSDADDDRASALLSERMKISQPITGQERERGLAALSLGFSPDPQARDALRSALATDPDARVRFMAAQSLLLHEHQDHVSFPAIAGLLRDLVTSGESASLDLVQHTAYLLGQYVTHARMGFVPSPTDDEIAVAVAAVRGARAGMPKRRRAAVRSLETAERVLLGEVPTVDGIGNTESGSDPGERPGPCPIPSDLTAVPLEITWNTATGWGDRRVNRAIRALDRWPRDVIVWAARPQNGPGLMVDAYGIPGCSADELDSAFVDAFFRPANGPWKVVEIDGRTVHRQAWVMGGTEGTVAWWASAGLVVHLVGDDPDVMAAIIRFP